MKRRADQISEDVRFVRNPIFRISRWFYSPEMLIPGAGTRLLRFAEKVAYSNSSSEADDVDTEELIIPGPAEDIRARVYASKESSESTPAVMHFHGGGWIAGNLNGSDDLCLEIARKTGATVISVDYRLAPENSFPAGFEDCYTATRYVQENPESFGVDPERMVVTGVSAGGNIAAAVALAARDRGKPDIERQVLIYPALYRGFDSDSYIENSKGYFLETEDIRAMWDLYLTEDTETDMSYAVPGKAETLTGLPPATIVTAGFDPLRDDGFRYADRLKTDEVPVNHLHYDDMIHGFVELAHQRDIDAGKEAIREVSQEIIDKAK